MSLFGILGTGLLSFTAQPPASAGIFTAAQVEAGRCLRTHFGANATPIP
jgi:hypothetical protein